jgi:hypothetical protein
MSVCQRLPAVRRSLDSIGDRWAAVMDDVATSLSRCAVASDLCAGLENATAAIGLGMGLTPSGDDFVGAFLFTLRVFEWAHPERIAVDWRRVEAWLRRVRGLTNTISYTLLADHANGYASFPLHELLDLSLAGAPLSEVARAGFRVSGIGHSSGSDMLSGVRCACRALARITGREGERTVHRPSGEEPRAPSRDEPAKEVVRV